MIQKSETPAAPPDEPTGPRIEFPALPADAAEIEAFARQLKAPPFVASLLLSRGIAEPEAARAFFLPETDAGSPSPPMADLDRAVKLLLAARDRGERVCVHGDYDVDGVTATALLVQALEALGFDVGWYLPSRFRDGYGLTAAGMERIAATGARWVVSVDTGITAVAEVEAARALGLKVIITDHHQAPETLPAAEAVLNPNRPGCPYPNKGLSGVGVAYRLAQALGRAAGKGDCDELLPWVALGSLADNAPLQGENRALVRAGMRRMASPKPLGLRVLLREAGVDPTDFGSQDLLFKVTPLLNAAGRLGTPEHSLRLLLARTEMEAKDCYRVLEEANRKRRELDAGITAEAVARIESDPSLRDAPCLALASDGWHEGVIGIVASRLVERYGRPAFVLSIDADGTAKGSGRTVPGFHLHKALSTCPELFRKWGGHYFACGFTLEPDRFETFRVKMEALARIHLGAGTERPPVRADASAGLPSIDADALLWLRRFEPFGPGNPPPTLVAEGVRLCDDPKLRPRRIGDKHLKFHVEHPGGGDPFEAVAFQMGDRLEWLESKGHLGKLAFHPEWNRFLGRKRIQLRVIAME